jgi:succinate dehydrogenase / fumarate reductase membrane anchor subunit
MDRYQTPLKRVRGLGSAKDGTHHWWVQRTSAMALALLTPWFLWRCATTPADFASVQAMVGLPYNALLLIAFITALFYHAQLGLQVVIEDYVHSRAAEVALLLAIKVLAWLGGGAAALAVLFQVFLRASA